jgi:hypothetical protein
MSGTVVGCGAVATTLGFGKEIWMNLEPRPETLVILKSLLEAASNDMCEAFVTGVGKIAAKLLYDGDLQPKGDGLFLGWRGRWFNERHGYAP